MRPFTRQLAMQIGCAAGLMLLLIAPSQGAQVDEWLQQMEHPRYPIFALRPENALDRYVSHDFSSLLIPRSQFLGFIGDDYRRLRIRINNVHREPDREMQNRAEWFRRLGPAEFDRSSRRSNLLGQGPVVRFRRAVSAGRRLQSARADISQRSAHWRSYSAAGNLPRAPNQASSRLAPLFPHTTPDECGL